MDVHLLVASQDNYLRDLCFSVSRLMGLEARATETAFDALNILKNGGVDIVLADAQMPGLNVVELIKAARGPSSESDVIILANAGNASLAPPRRQPGRP
ncbi:MAG TPA: hypothetical protein VNM47_15520 [Terriglobia bacterium]|nr:hypothetical protein [Terriglobia bacterium]